MEPLQQGLAVISRGHARPPLVMFAVAPRNEEAGTDLDCSRIDRLNHGESLVDDIYYLLAGRDAHCILDYSDRLSGVEVESL